MEADTPEKVRAQRKAGAQYPSDVTIASDGTCVYVDAIAMR